MQYYPVYLDLRGRRVVVVGGGTLAEEKVKGLLEAGAAVTVIAPRLNEALQGWADEGLVEWHAREYAPGDLAGAFMAISSLNAPEVGEPFWEEATELGILANVMDDVPHCNFIAASILRRGDLTITVSTSGKAPALAVRLRQRLERELGDEYARFLELAGSIREPLAARFPPSRSANAAGTTSSIPTCSICCARATSPPRISASRTLWVSRQAETES